MIAFGLLLIIWLQRSCGRNRMIKTEAVHDTILIKGDTQLFTVQDTILQPYKVYFRDSMPDVDTARIIKDYFAGRIYRDTIKARDVTAVIEDSISDNKMEGHKVLIENSRALHLSTCSPKRNLESPTKVIIRLRNICRTIVSMCLSLISTPCNR